MEEKAIFVDRSPLPDSLRHFLKQTGGRMNKKATWVVVILVMIYNTYHYQQVFQQVEHAGIGQGLSWTAGAIFDLVCLLFIYNFAKMESGWKWFYISSIIGFTLFLQWEYYTATIKPIWERALFSLIWPILLAGIAFLAREKKETAPGTREVKRESLLPLENLEIKKDTQGEPKKKRKIQDPGVVPFVEGNLKTDGKSTPIRSDIEKKKRGEK